MFERAVTVVQYPNAVPQLGVLLQPLCQLCSQHRRKGAHLWIREMIQRLLVRRVRFLQLVLHKVTVSQRRPDISIRVVYAERAGVILDSLDGPCAVIVAVEGRLTSAAGDRWKNKNRRIAWRNGQHGNARHGDYARGGAQVWGGCPFCTRMEKHTCQGKGSIGPDRAKNK